VTGAKRQALPMLGALAVHADVVYAGRVGHKPGVARCAPILQALTLVHDAQMVVIDPNVELWLHKANAIETNKLFCDENHEINYSHGTMGAFAQDGFLANGFLDRRCSDTHVDYWFIGYCSVWFGEIV